MIKRFYHLILLSLMFFALPLSSAQAALDKMVAIVNNEVITQSELRQNIAEAKQQFAAHNISIPNEKTLKKRVLDGLIDQKLQLQFAKNVGFNISDAEVDEVIVNIAKSNKLSVTQFKAELAKHGINYTGYRNRMKQEVLLRKLQQEVLGPKIMINDQEVKAFMKKAQNMQVRQAKAMPDNRKYRVLDMLIQLPENASASQMQQVKDKAVDLLHKMGKGTNFAQFAKDNQVTDLGFRKLSDLPDIFVKAVKKMKVKDVAGPIIAPNGLHIIKLMGIRGEMQQPSKITFNQAKEFVFQQKFTGALKNWLMELRARAYIKITNNG